MSPEKIKPVDMGYIFENLTQRFSESQRGCGAHFTSRDIVYLMTDLLVAADPHVFDGDHISKTVYDQTMGTPRCSAAPRSACARWTRMPRVTTFGQEFNPFTYGIAKANALIRGNDDSNMQFGDTLLATSSRATCLTTASRTHPSATRGTPRRTPLPPNTRKALREDSPRAFRQGRRADAFHP